MESTKEVFINQVNQKGVLLIRQRNPKDDLTGWGALEFILNDGTVFVISSTPFGQGDGEDGFWVDMNSYDDEKVQELKHSLNDLDPFPKTPSQI